MIYVSWAVLYEGTTDRHYFDVLIPKLIEAILLEHGRVKFAVPNAPVLCFARGSIDEIAAQICENKDAFFLVFVHADTGGRAQEAAIGSRGGDVATLAGELCDFEPARCVLVAPRHEMEGWALADPKAVCATLGFNGNPDEIGLPENAAEAEALADPKAVLSNAIARVRGRRKTLPAELLFPVIAEEQSLAVLAQSRSFREFRNAVYAALKSLGSVS